MKVLIVEDDAPSRNFLKDTMESQGYKTYVSENGLLGLKAFKKFAPDLVLSDIRMPKMDGLQLLQEIRKIDRRTFVVMTTAFGSEDYAIKALRLRANNYLKKPLRHKELLALLKKYAEIVERRSKRKKPPKKEEKLKSSLKISNDISVIPEIVDGLIRATGDALDETDKQDTCLSLVELLTNAIEHGNLGITREEKSKALDDGLAGLYSLYNKRMKNSSIAARKVKIDYNLSDTFCEWRITDAGKGFDWKTFLNQLNSDPFGMECKGLFICEFHLDDLKFLGKGNVVRARKLRSLK